MEEWGAEQAVVQERDRSTMGQQTLHVPVLEVLRRVEELPARMGYGTSFRFIDQYHNVSRPIASISVEVRL